MIVDISFCFFIGVDPITIYEIVNGKLFYFTVDKCQGKYILSHMDTNITPVEFSPLATKFTKRGFEYELVERRGDIAIYKQSKVVAFEVVKIQKRPEWVIGGNTVPAHESMPSDSQWGMAGWTLDNLESAQSKMAKIESGVIDIEDSVNDTPEDEDETDSVKDEPKAPRAPKSTAVLTIPDSEFTITEMADKNGVQYPVAFLFIKDALSNNKIKVLRKERRGNARRSSKIFAKV